ncbi:MAG: site-2 protease family protein, partial [Planctomycetaceae bacterium]|nr:site-2 protease family protein [Planctomycetaceae bacterium]
FHELGHFLVAKWCGVYVECFSIGFGPYVVSRKWGDTVYALSLFPLGGYVKMRGQDDMDPGEMTDEEIAADPRSYTAKNVPQRMAIISAGVIMNIITGLMFFMLAFRWGVEVPERVVGYVAVGMPAWQYGIRTGDEILDINGREIHDFSDVMVATALSQGPLTIQLRDPDGQERTVTVVPEMDSTRKIGVGYGLSLNVLDSPDPEKFPIASPGTAASRVEFQSKDRILAVNDVPVATYSEFVAELSRHAADSVELRIDRQGSEEELLLPAEPGLELGFKVSMGLVAAIQKGGPAEQAGLRADDHISKIDDLDVEGDLDPFTLTEYFSSKAGQEVKVTYTREVEGGPPTPHEVTLIPEERSAWAEPPGSEGAPLSIPSIGLAYNIVPVVFSVDPDGPAAELGIAARDKLTKIEFIRAPGGELDGLAEETEAVNINDKNWAYAYWMLQQSARTRVVKLTTERGDEKATKEITPRESKTWYLQTTRGLSLDVLSSVRVAKNLGDAIHMGWDHTTNSIRQVYLTLRGLVTGDISYKLVSGPIGIAKTAYRTADMGLPQFVLFLGLISVNLAVVNFLPIPVLDGGHMVFLLWEGITGRRPNEKVVGYASTMGLVLLLTLIILVVYLDLFVSKM